MNKKIAKIIERDKKMALACFNELGYNVELDDGYYSGVYDGKREYIFLEADPNKEGLLVIASIKGDELVIRYSRVYEGYYERVRYTFVDGELTDRNEFVSYNEAFGKQL